MTYTIIFGRVPDTMIGGPYTVQVWRNDNRVVSSVSGCRDRARAASLAYEYASSYGTNDVREVRP